MDKYRSLLTNMAQQAKVHVTKAENYFKQAQKAAKDTATMEAKLEQAIKKLDLIHQQINAQLKIVTDMVQKLREQKDLHLNEVIQLRTEQEQALRELDAVLEKLLATPVHPSLIEATNAMSMAGSSSNTTMVDQQLRDSGGSLHGSTTTTSTTGSLLMDKETLHDFVNIESVDQLKLHAEKELSEIKQLQNTLSTVMQSVEDQYHHLSQNSMTLIARMNEAKTDMSSPSTVQKEQKNELDSMSYIVLKIASHHDRLDFLLRSTEQVISTVELADLRKLNEELPQYVATLHESLQKILSLSNEIDSRARRYHEFYRTAVNFHADLDRISPVIQNKVNQLSVLQSVFDERRRGSQELFEEITDLTTWYGLFLTSYGELLNEVERRREEQKRQQQLIASYNAELLKMYTEETQKRNQFLEYYGKYLPSYLCPPIMDPPVRYRVVADGYGYAPSSLEETTATTTTAAPTTTTTTTLSQQRARSASASESMSESRDSNLSTSKTITQAPVSTPSPQPAAQQQRHTGQQPPPPPLQQQSQPSHHRHS